MIPFAPDNGVGALNELTSLHENLTFFLWWIVKHGRLRDTVQKFGGKLRIEDGECYFRGYFCGEATRDFWVIFRLQVDIGAQYSL
mmetsp:Transcript_24056/g.50576  ORF Transcript_24056/g.50576 Transcript_24056/m.50576 type:complete len:85 (-) Transcript_24056:157-411(-)